MTPSSASDQPARSAGERQEGQRQPEGTASPAGCSLERLLEEGDISVEGLIPWSSNATLLVTIHDTTKGEHGGPPLLAIYKPQKGETPLWDFPAGTLCRREVAAYRVCEALGWRFVPPTVLRKGPYGLGSVQAFVRARRDVHFFTIRDDPRWAGALRRLAAFDILVNNADKSGHCLVDEDGELWAIDNALTFHVEPKLRTVIWDYVGEAIPEADMADLSALHERLSEGGALDRSLRHLLSREEVMALRRRLRHLCRLGRFPTPGPGRPVPWPLV